MTRKVYLPTFFLVGLLAFFSILYLSGVSLTFYFLPLAK